MRSGIYKIANAANGRCYIGSAIHLVNRWASHRRSLRRGEHRNRYLQRAWDKYGEAAFSFIILEEVNEPAQLVVREQAHIDEWTKEGKLYNLAPRAGSNLGTKRTEASKAKARASNRGLKRSDEARAAMAAAQLRSNGENPELKAMRAEQLKVARQRIDREKQRTAVGAASKARIWSDESRAKLSASCIGRKLTPETKAKISATKLKAARATFITRSVLHG